MNNEVSRFLLRYGIAIVIALLCVTFLGRIFSPQPTPYVFEPAINRFVVKPGTYVRFYDGWQSTTVGRYGVPGFADITKLQGDIFCFWGDSFVEAREVATNNKLPQQINSLLREAGKEGTCIGTGTIGWCVADYYEQIPYYEALLPNLREHYILLVLLGDFEPQTGRREAQFERNPFRFVSSTWSPKHRQTKLMLSDYGMYSWWYVLKRLAEHPGLRFALGPNLPSDEHAFETESKSTINDRVAAWRFSLQQLRSVTSKPINLVYSPVHVATVSDNQLVLENDQEKILKHLAEACADNNVRLIRADHALIDLAKNQNVLPRGYHSERLGQGHFNRFGLREIAKVVADDRERRQQ